MEALKFKDVDCVISSLYTLSLHLSGSKQSVLLPENNVSFRRCFFKMAPAELLFVFRSSAGGVDLKSCESTALLSTLKPQINLADFSTSKLSIKFFLFLTLPPPQLTKLQVTPGDMRKAAVGSFLACPKV